MMSIINFLTSDGLGLGGSLSDSGLSSMMQTVENVVDTLMIIIYIVLGLFLVVKGAILGLQIVKAADEPQVRQEKIGSLKWLVIGIAIAYGVSFATDILVGYFIGLM